MSRHDRAVACRVGFVGAGATIREHIRAFAGVDGVEIVGIANRTIGKAEKVARELGVPAVFDGVDELCGRARPDLLVMAVYETAIRAVAEACLEQDVALLMEKPVGLDLGEARHLATLARRRGRRVWVGLNRRALPSTRRVLDDLADDPAPRFVHVQDQQSLELARMIGHSADVVRNWMFTNSIHLVDYLPLLARGAATAVENIVPWDPLAPGLVLSKVAFTSGDIGLYEALWHAPGPWACTVATARRRWELRPLEHAAFQNPGERALQQVEPAPVDSALKPGLRIQAERVVAAWRGEPSAAPTIDDALATTELVARIYAVPT